VVVACVLSRGHTHTPYFALTVLYAVPPWLQLVLRGSPMPRACDLPQRVLVPATYGVAHEGGASSPLPQLSLRLYLYIVFGMSLGLGQGGTDSSSCAYSLAVRGGEVLVSNSTWRTKCRACLIDSQEVDRAVTRQLDSCYHHSISFCGAGVVYVSCPHDVQLLCWLRLLTGKPVSGAKRGFMTRR